MIAYLTRRMERSFAAAASLAAQLDKLALSEGSAITIPLAAAGFAAQSLSDFAVT